MGEHRTANGYHHCEPNDDATPAQLAPEPAPISDAEIGRGLAVRPVVDFHPGEKRKNLDWIPAHPGSGPVACGPRSSNNEGDRSCCGGSSRLLLSGFVAARSSRLFGRSAWRLGGGSRRLRPRLRAWLPN